MTFARKHSKYKYKRERVVCPTLSYVLFPCLPCPAVSQPPQPEVVAREGQGGTGKAYQGDEDTEGYRQPEMNFAKK